MYSRESFFSILTPDNLVMKSKVYNSNQIPTDTILNNERSINYGFKNVMPQQEEKYSGQNANRFVRIKLEGNTREMNLLIRCSSW